MKRMIAVRKTIPNFADYNNREMLDTGNPHLFAFARVNPLASQDTVFVVGNFDASPQPLHLRELEQPGRFEVGRSRDLYTGEVPDVNDDCLTIPSYGFYWLKSMG